ncbi:MAG TPA: molybdopterin dinucleotide binding domain-containing protein, partial [Dehalococcoidia bacterium]|nr:molybdopterin dinucleotide binding domain-containing protein [Dehalococcoidia bacterium]
DPLWEARPLTAVLRGLADRLGLDTFYPWADQDAAISAVLEPIGGGAMTIDRLRAEGGAHALEVSHVAYPDHRYHTPSGKVEFYSRRAEETGLPPLPVYEPPDETAPDHPLAARFPLIFRQGRTFSHFHSFYLSSQALPSLAQADPDPLLWIHPDDAAARSIASGDWVEMANDRGMARAKAKVTDEIGRGVVWMRDGWIGVNRLTNGKSTLPLSANEVMGFPAGQATYEARVEVRRAEESGE